jgi:MoxR-like ATPase
MTVTAPTPRTSPDLEDDLESFRQAMLRITESLHQVIVGQDHVVQSVLWAVILQGHVLLEGVPGLGKTVLMSTLGQSLGLQTSRVQFTPDLMPADILGTRMIEQDERGSIRFTFERGPVFTQILLADEINRATPKTQSALLEAMQERHVSISGTTYDLPRPFMVMATQNPIEQEGTYPLPEAQLDRFLFKLLVRFPTELELIEIAKRTVTGASGPACVPAAATAADLLKWSAMVRAIPLPTEILQHAARLILATHPSEKRLEPKVAAWIRYGASPRGLQALTSAARLRAILDGRTTVRRDDVNEVAMPCLRHRVLLSFEAETEGITPDRLIEEVVKRNQ